MQMLSGESEIGSQKTSAERFYRIDKAEFQDGSVVKYLAQVGSGLAVLDPPLVINKNTVIRKFDVVLQAARATQTRVESVAQVRAYSNAGSHTIVIDFGTPRTASYIRAPSGIKIMQVAAWAGAQFGFPFYVKNATGAQQSATFASEVRAERLLVTVDKAISEETLGKEMILELPDPPSDLEIRINDGAPVWVSPGPVQPGADGPPTATQWNGEAKRSVSLADALNALAADPLADEPATFNIVLSSKVPGLLDITADPAPQLSHVHRVRFGAETSTDLNFTEEGYQQISLTLPALPSGLTRYIEEVRLTAIAALPPERVRPPIGPPWAPAPPGPGSPVLAELVLDPDRAACVRLGRTSELAELTAVRLPLVAAGDGAEVRAVLWGNKDAGSQEPTEPIPNGASAPVILTGGASPDDWATFAFAKPVMIDNANPPWVAVLVTRGTVGWSLAKNPVTSTRADDLLVAASELRRGAPNGPWRKLPAPFTSSAPPAVMDARGRVRMVGHGAKTAPVAPIVLQLRDTLSLLGDVTEVTPTAKGVPVLMKPLPAFPVTSADPALVIVSRVVGALTLRDVDVVWREA